ncbi:MAG TPA: hypothetical protein VJ650_12280 [Gemmatimonadaceae bacterium]|nr:hypothetical protein [Gemmatimonadaceae bacterium]
MTGPASAALSASPPAAKRVRLASALLVIYGLIVIVNAVLLQSAAGWIEWPQFFRAVVRLGGMLLIAWGLLRGERWAWWMAVGLGLFWLVTGALVVAGSWIAFGGVSIPAPVYSQVLLAVAVLLLATGIGLLLTRPVRVAFRRPPAT